MNLRRLTLVLAAVVGLLLAACGGAGDPEATAEVVPIEVDSASAGNVTIYRISSDESQVRFELDENLDVIAGGGDDAGVSLLIDTDKTVGAAR